MNCNFKLFFFLLFIDIIVSAVKNFNLCFKYITLNCVAVPLWCQNGNHEYKSKTVICASVAFRLKKCFAMWCVCVCVCVGGEGGCWGNSTMWTILVCAAPKGMVFQPFWS